MGGVRYQQCGAAVNLPERSAERGCRSNGGDVVVGAALFNVVLEVGTNPHVVSADQIVPCMQRASRTEIRVVRKLLPTANLFWTPGTPADFIRVVPATICCELGTLFLNTRPKLKLRYSHLTTNNQLQKTQSAHTHTTPPLGTL